VTVADVLREHARHDAERRSALMRCLLEEAASDWEDGGAVREVLGPYAHEPAGAALPLRFAAALHRLVLTGQAPELAAHYATAGGTASPGQAWPAARRAIAEHAEQLRTLIGLPCQTNEVGRAVLLLIGLSEIFRRTGRPVKLLEIGASAGLNLLVDRFRYGPAYGPVDSPCVLPDPGMAIDSRLRIASRAGCDPAPLDPTTDEGRLRLRSSVWGDQPARMQRLQGALAVASQSRVPVDEAGAVEWLAQGLPARADDEEAVPVVWHSIVRTYVDPEEWAHVQELASRPGVWRLAYEPDPDHSRGGIPLRLHGPRTDPAGEVLAYGTGHGPPVLPVGAG
jgi:hypothetical protein